MASGSVSHAWPHQWCLVCSAFSCDQSAVGVPWGVGRFLLNQTWWKVGILTHCDGCWWDRTWWQASPLGSAWTEKLHGSQKLLVCCWKPFFIASSGREFSLFYLLSHFNNRLVEGRGWALNIFTQIIDLVVCFLFHTGVCSLDKNKEHFWKA